MFAGAAAAQRRGGQLFAQAHMPGGRGATPHSARMCAGQQHAHACMDAFSSCAAALHNGGVVHVWARHAAPPICLALRACVQRVCRATFAMLMMCCRMHLTPGRLCLPHRMQPRLVAGTSPRTVYRQQVPCTVHHTDANQHPLHRPLRFTCASLALQPLQDATGNDSFPTAGGGDGWSPADRPPPPVGPPMAPGCQAR